MSKYYNKIIFCFFALLFLLSLTTLYAMDLTDSSDKKLGSVKQNSGEFSSEKVIEKQIFEDCDNNTGELYKTTQTKVIRKIPEKKQCCLVF